MSDTLIAEMMKCVISMSHDALGSYQITLLSQTDALISFIAFYFLSHTQAHSSPASLETDSAARGDVFVQLISLRIPKGLTGELSARF